MDSQLRELLHSFGANEGFAEELYRVFQSNPEAVPETWREIFRSLPPTGNGHGIDSGVQSGGTAPVRPAAQRPLPPLQAGEQLAPLRGAAARIAANMEASLGVPTATSQRSVPVRLLEENRHLLNNYLATRGLKVPLTPLLGWALVRALREFPAINSGYREQNGEAARVEREHINLGLAVDVEAHGTHLLLVPVVKNCEVMNFRQFLGECDRLIRGARASRLGPEDLQGASVTLTNPGTLGTRSSVPRLMPGQGAIIAAGAVAYPAGFEGMPETTMHSLGVGKTVTLSCTYDHRVIQGAESGAFLALVNELLLGKHEFYDRIFADLQVPFKPVAWSVDAHPLALTGASAELDQIRQQAAVFQLVHAFRVRGHLLANVDPLDFTPLEHPELDPSYYSLSLWDLDRKFLTSISGDGNRRLNEPSASPWHPTGDEKLMSLREILSILRATYCGTLSCEFMHLPQLDQRTWLQDRMEPTRNQWPLEPALRKRVLDKLTHAEAFERMLHTRYVGHKRFSLEGAETLIPALDHLLNLATGCGAEEVLIGMAHRGRLNVLCNTVGQPMSTMFAKFEDADPNSVEGSGDVKYHLGAAGRHETPEGKSVAVTVVPNPSHLEAVDPVLEGAARARQELIQDSDGSRVLPILIHGDAAFAGQGVVAETLNLSQLEGYTTGGTVHIVVNNKIGFTTSPADARSSLYSTDVARMVQAPIFHVNGDDPDAVMRAIELAFYFRHHFHKDVVLDLVCYRRHGHNEGDDPTLTQPVLYRNIDQHPSVRVIYGGKLVGDKVIDPEEPERLWKQTMAILGAAVPDKTATSGAPAAGAGEAAEKPVIDTAVPAEVLSEVGAALDRRPEGFTVHPKLKHALEKRCEAVRERAAIDWSLAESLALGSLLAGGTPIRFTGQDVGRGTFSHRHARLYDYQTGACYVPLSNVSAGQAPFSIHDSLLSEEAALGFEFGYSMTHPNALVLWEAQFGDFANGAQVIIDQFLVAAARKWKRHSGLVMLLPHAYEGQGPEHSSGRMERFLQLCADNNLQVANCTTAAQYFHLLRRQGLGDVVGGAYRQPLIVFTPKSLLRHPEVASPFEQFTSGAFQPVIGEHEVAPAKAQRVVFCCGKVFYDLLKARREANDDTTAVIRVEQLYPLPVRQLKEEIARFKGVREWIWMQEEPANMGAWRYLEPNLGALLGERKLQYAGREASSSPATGSLRRHQREQKQILDGVLKRLESAAD